MEYHTTQQVDARQWDTDQAAVVAEIRRGVEHDLIAQNPDAAVRIDGVTHTVRPAAGAPESAAGTSYVVDFVFRYTVGDAPNTFDA